MKRFTSRSSDSANDSGWIVEDSNTDTNMFFGRPNSTMRVADESSFLTSMSFASLQVGECKPSEGEEEVDRKSFERWRSVLESGMDLAGITDEKMRASIFTIKAGVKLLVVLENSSSTGAPDERLFPYSNMMHRLSKYFGSRDYTLTQRQKLRSMTQGTDESDLKYVRRVIMVAKLCAYNSEQLLETVVDVIQNHALNQKVREAGRKIARKGGSLQDLSGLRGRSIFTLLCHFALSFD